jgi:hypothetical protein
MIESGAVGGTLGGLTLATLLLGAGAFPAAAVIRQLIEVLKVAIPEIDRNISGARQAFLLSLVLYVVAWVAVGDKSAEGAFAAVLVWLACATSAIGINSALDHVDDLRSEAEAEGAYIPRADGQL